METRQEKSMPNGIPRYIRLYDNQGETIDRYTCVFTGRYEGSKDQKIYLGMSSDPFHPMGVGMHGESETPIDREGYSHLGKKVKFEDIPEQVKKCILQTYTDLWDLK